MHRFYHTNVHEQEFTLSETESSHAVKVLRLGLHDKIEICNGKGHLAIAQIVDANFRKLTVKVIEVSFHPSPFSYSLHLAIAPTKNTERMDWMIEKAVETGVSKITFIKCKHSERDKMNMDRCYKIAISAMKQSKQYWLPEIEDIQPFQKVVEKNTADLKLIAWCNADRKAILRSYITNATQSIVALIGPEGDFDADEIHLAEKNGFQYLYLTPSTLRTETAALYISMAVGAIAQQI